MSIEDLYRDYYADDREQAWHEICAVDKAKNILEFCRPVAPRLVLDIGAGNGAVTQRVLDGGLALEMHAVEISDSGLAQLRQRLGTRLREIKKFDGLRLPYEDDSFDLAILSHVVEHVEHPRLLLYEARRVAKFVYVEVPLEVIGLRKNLHGDWAMDTTGHINYYNRHMIRRLLQTSGYKVLRQEVRMTDVGPYSFQKGFRGVVDHAVKRIAFALFPRFSQQIFCFHCCLLGERAERLSTSLGEVHTSGQSGNA